MKRCGEVVPLLGPLADAALPDDDRAWVEEHLRGCPSCTDRLALLRAQGDALREALAARAAQVDLSGLAAKVLARVEKEPARAPIGVWGLEMWGAHRTAFSALGGLAVAAGLALAVFFAPPPSSADDERLLADNTSQVEEVEFGTHDGAVLQLPQNTTVIWMSDDRAVSQ